MITIIFEAEICVEYLDKAVTYLIGGFTIECWGRKLTKRLLYECKGICILISSTSFRNI